jgi:hypothetical protein
MAEKVISLRDKLRAKTVGAKKEFRQTEVTWDGETFIVKQPTVAQRAYIMSKAKAQSAFGKDDPDRMDLGELMVWAAIHCTYTPDGEKVFEESDHDSLIEQPSGSFVDEFGSAALGLMNVDSKEIAKNSDKTPNDNSSTK